MEDAAGSKGTYGPRDFHKQAPSIRLGATAVGSPLPVSTIGRGGLRKALQSPWVQRLKPLNCSTNDSPDKQAHVLSHFAEDFSSCQRPSDRCLQGFLPRFPDAHTQKSVLLSLLLPQPVLMSDENDLCSSPPDGPSKDKPLHSISTFDVEGDCPCVPEDDDTYSTEASIRTVGLFSPGRRTHIFSWPSKALVPLSQDAHRPKALNVFKLHHLDGEESMADNLAASGHSKQGGSFKKKLMDSDAIKVCNSRLKEPLVSPAVGCKGLMGVNVLSSCVSGNINKERRHTFSLRSRCNMDNIKGASADADDVKATVSPQVATENSLLSLSNRAAMGRSKFHGVRLEDPQQSRCPSPSRKHSYQQSVGHTPIAAVVEWGNQTSDPRVESKFVTGLRRFDVQEQGYPTVLCEEGASQKLSQSKSGNFLSGHIVDIVHDNKMKGTFPAVPAALAANVKFSSGNSFYTIRAQLGCSKKNENEDVHENLLADRS